MLLLGCRAKGTQATQLTPTLEEQQGCGVVGQGGEGWEQEDSCFPHYGLAT